MTCPVSLESRTTVPAARLRCPFALSATRLPSFLRVVLTALVASAGEL